MCGSVGVKLLKPCPLPLLSDKLVNVTRAGMIYATTHDLTCTESFASLYEIERLTSMKAR